MQNVPLGKRPRYAVESVDGALQLLQILRDEGELRVGDAARMLETSPSTAHRLLAMLVYRGFAVQDEGRMYLPGPGMSVPPVRSGWAREIRDLTRGRFEELVAEIGETANLMVRFGTTVRFIATFEADGASHVSDRRGQVLQARLASGGKALLANLNEAALTRLYRSEAAELSGDLMPERAFAAFQRELRGVRRRGYALNREATEPKVGAVGMALPSPAGASRVAFSIAVPVERFNQRLDSTLLDAARRFRADLADLLGAAQPTEPAASASPGTAPGAASS
jgi:IclR family transcriptional regulator, acetate operon repressor